MNRIGVQKSSTPYSGNVAEVEISPKRPKDLINEIEKRKTKMKKIISPIFFATIWISFSEFLRNEILLKSYWTDHYEKLGLVFPSEPINGVVWGLWSLCFAISIFFILKKFSLTQTTIIAWIMGFVLMWIVTGNMSVLPFSILIFAIPLSILETLLAALIIKKIGQ